MSDRVSWKKRMGGYSILYLGDRPTPYGIEKGGDKLWRVLKGMSCVVAGPYARQKQAQFWAIEFAKDGEEEGRR